RESTEEILEIDDLLNRLASLHPRQARVVEFRIFVGMTVPEVAQALKVSVATVEKDWRQARAWIQSKLGQSPLTSSTR
ncbi:MAG: ECF-type sigma factor, partial [Myxococcota bacterium]